MVFSSMGAPLLHCMFWLCKYFLWLRLGVEVGWIGPWARVFEYIKVLIGKFVKY